MARRDLSQALSKEKRKYEILLSLVGRGEAVLQDFQGNDPPYSHPVSPVNPCLVPPSAAIQL